MATTDLTLTLDQAIDRDLAIIRARLAILHRELDVAGFWKDRARLRADIQQTQADLRAALDRRNALEAQEAAP